VATQAILLHELEKGYNTKRKKEENWKWLLTRDWHQGEEETINFVALTLRHTVIFVLFATSAYPAWTTNSVTLHSAPSRRIRDLCWDTAWRRGTLRF
jgi:hypothetical protein